MPISRIVTGSALALAIALAGCTATGPVTSEPPADDCGATALQSKIGEPVTGRTAADAQVGGEPVQSLGNVRVVAPGEAVTMDFNRERLTIETDAQGNLARAVCT